MKEKELKEFAELYQLSDSEAKKLIHYVGQVYGSASHFRLTSEHVMGLEEKQREKYKYEEELQNYKWLPMTKKFKTSKPKAPRKYRHEEKARDNFLNIDSRVCSLLSFCSIHQINVKDAIRDTVRFDPTTEGGADSFRYYQYIVNKGYFEPKEHYNW